MSLDLRHGRMPRCSRTAQDKCALDNAFTLIEGHPDTFFMAFMADDI